MILNPIRFARTVWRTVVRLCRRQPILVTPEQHKERVDICPLCPHYLPKTDQCGLCSCFVHAKAWLRGETCDDNAWPILDGDTKDK